MDALKLMAAFFAERKIVTEFFLGCMVKSYRLSFCQY
ncbi:hypothetical protein LLNZ_04495 [Lactococcus cremoris subsp. cremoris NZ9000]|nr:hypothetical protein LLNZ_04495 [Lactococcus cremoris subsp. cremoris NZ9000]